jgi:hypothetical protein
MAELLFRFVVGVVFEIVVLGALDLAVRAGQSVTRAIVPLVSGGRILVVPVPNNLVVVERWNGIHRLTNGTPVIGKALATILGFLLLLFAAVCILIAVLSVWNIHSFGNSSPMLR